MKSGEDSLVLLLLHMRAQGGHTTKLLCKRWVGVAALLLLMMMMWLLLRMGLLLLLQRVRILKVVGTRCTTTMDQNLRPDATRDEQAPNQSESQSIPCSRSSRRSDSRK
jgi:hypothetical protein